MIISGETYACEACIRGHRTARCQHNDRPLQLIKKKGRPVSQCNHCRSMRQSRSAHVKCECAKRAREGRVDTANGGREPCRCFEDGICRCAFKRDPSAADALSPSGSEHGTNSAAALATSSSPAMQGCCGTPSTSTSATATDTPAGLDSSRATDLPPLLDPADAMMDMGTSWLDAIPHDMEPDFLGGAPFDFSNFDVQPGSFDPAAPGDAPPAPTSTHIAPLEEVPGTMATLPNSNLGLTTHEWTPNQYNEHEISVFGVPESAWFESLGMGPSKVELLPEEDGKVGHGVGNPQHDAQR
ncbi:transcriptional activator haa1 [Purpureocillium takamizusanense]|uniref:Transcriptional activator haa1 n=1 Tax=Purpureocillium takamizusanense TaxID=2060973 RepID=A0A9Q8Q633_9HYPO|nr:transcriptional activator haa1 [Purpureocillium takamizusanense]UNI13710.1 transcriptional activator haa1 [Purpureocillium takamizusanense]